MFERQESEAKVAESGSQEISQRLGAAPEPDLTWNVLGLRVGRKTEIIALVAFTLSLGGIMWQVFNFARGAVVRLFPSDQVVLTAMDKLGRNYSGQGNNIALIAAMSYSNEADVGHNAIIRREFIQVTFGDRALEHRWYEFGSSDLKDGALEFKRESEARPFPITAGSAVSHETLFAPWEIQCSSDDKNCDTRANFVKWNEFLNAVRANGKISVTTRATVYPDKVVTASCEINLRSWEITYLESDQWLSVTCNEVGDGQRREVRRPLSR